MGSHGILSIIAVLLAIATMAVLVATSRVKNGWMAWFVVPVIAFMWYWVLVCLFVGYYMWRINGVR